MSVNAKTNSSSGENEGRVFRLYERKLKAISWINRKERKFISMISDS